MDSDFQRLLAQGGFKNDPSFFQNQQNLLKVLNFLQEVAPRPEVMDIVLALLKFFRFPLALCCHSLYRRISASPGEQIQALREGLQQVAAYVRSLVKELGVEMFEQIRFFFQWGQAKKKYKMSVLEEQRKFAQFIWEMSQQKIELSKGKWEAQSQRKIDQFLGANFKGANLFEQRSIQFMKSSALPFIDALEASREEQRPVEVVKHKEAKSVQHREEPEKPKRNESIPLQNQYSRPVMEEERGVCCRTFFTKGEFIGQPQSLRIEYKYYCFPFVSKAGEVPSKRDKIKRTLCGFLNAQGGTIYFGIKEIPDSKERLINGMILSENSKKKFGTQIHQIMQDVLPDIGKKWSIKYVPVKDARGSYITGCFVAKVIVERGSRDQVYSYIPQNYYGYTERFAFKTENEVLEISDVQRVLKIFKDKVMNTHQRDHYPTHPHPCPQPQFGKPLYEDKMDYRNDDSFQYEERRARVPKYEEKRQYGSNGKYNDNLYDRYAEGRKDYFQDPIDNNFPSLLQDRNGDNWYEQYENSRNRKYEGGYVEQRKQKKDTRFMQKQTNQFLLQTGRQDIQIMLRREGIVPKFITDVVTDVQNIAGWTYLVLENSKQSSKLVMFYGVVLPVYQRISYHKLSKDQLSLMESIIMEYRNHWSVITKERFGEIIVFNNSLNACVFYIKMREMGLDVEFTPFA